MDIAPIRSEWISFDAIEPAPLTPMLNLQRVLPALRSAHRERTAQLSAWQPGNDSDKNREQASEWPLDLARRKTLRSNGQDAPSTMLKDAHHVGDDELFREAAAILIDEKRLLHP